MQNTPLLSSDMPERVPHTFYAHVFASVDRTDRPSLRRRLEPFAILFAQLMNIAVVGALLFGIGWASLRSTGTVPRHFSWTYLTGTLFGFFAATSYVGLQSLFVFYRNFIMPT